MRPGARWLSHVLAGLVASTSLGACAETFQEKVVRRYRGIPETLRVSADDCSDPDLALPASRSEGDPGRVRQLRDVRTRPELVGYMLDHALEKQLYQSSEHPLARSLAEGVERVLSALDPVSPLSVDLTLIAARVDSFTTSKMTLLKGPVIARFEFAAELRFGEASDSIASSRFAGEVRQDVWQATTRNHQTTLNRAFCTALDDFGGWARSLLPAHR